MDTLFPFDKFLPEGFVYLPDFLSPLEEEHLCNQIKETSLHTFIFQGYEAKRKVASFGYDYSFDKRVLTKGADIPTDFDWLLQKVRRRVNALNEFAEMLITEYPPGSVINWHRDAPPFDMIVGISLASNCTFRFRPHDKAKQNRKAIISFPLEKRSLYVLQGASRTEWQHSIMPVKTLRYSVTLRTLKQ
ncbi:alpha-ketoglutarate-dependent dioxygenase AlkB [Chryseolinea sp. H1M3-3]|uniref:alpha-ketoglutarate-dependent dioxygenase AlkB n=1 Tax=Chryseolinea sp. H1M3-3 TaxID=3034144 RepID=UPI0023EDCDC1|nr:alpha-ketoglutarate-dependent dioxygenase AlkB [Chryseolinea sp. H1M3-3]